MKKFISVFLFLAGFIGVSVAQSTTPRYFGPNNDNTGRSLNYNWVAKTDVAGADTLKFTPDGYKTTIRLTLTDSFGLSIKSATKSYAGDQMQVIASGASGTKVKFIGTGFQTAGTATLSTGLFAVVDLVFSGTKWVEYSRVVQ
jgi:hypothetical protein